VALVRGAPDVLTADELIATVWAGRVVNEETVAKRVELVRESLGDDSRSPRYITAGSRTWVSARGRRGVITSCAAVA
jgi:DNA-binding winged helix-turn-helix (wHTH) protein